MSAGSVAFARELAVLAWGAPEPVELELAPGLPSARRARRARRDEPEDGGRLCFEKGPMLCAELNRAAAGRLEWARFGGWNVCNGETRFRFCVPQ